MPGKLDEIIKTDLSELIATQVGGEREWLIGSRKRELKIAFPTIWDGIELGIKNPNPDYLGLSW